MRSEIQHNITQKILEFKTNNPILTKQIHSISKEDESQLFTLIADILCYKLNPYIPAVIDDIRLLFYQTYSQDDIQQLIIQDIVAIKDRDPASKHFLNIILNYKGFHAACLHRISHTLWQKGNADLARFLSNLSSSIFAVDIHPSATIARGFMMDHGTGIVIGETAVIDENVSILQNVTLGGTGKEQGDRHPKIKSGVLIGAGAKILGNITIHKNCKIGAGSIVLQDIPPYSTAVGIPAKVVSHNAPEIIPAVVIDQSY
ncbi:serine O-acetyltransferase [Ignatzschineria sp. LJL83]